LFPFVILPGRLDIPHKSSGFNNSVEKPKSISAAYYQSSKMRKKSIVQAFGSSG